MKNILLICSLLIVCLSCSQSKKINSKISLSLSTQALTSMTGGLVVYGRNNTTNDSFVRVIPTSTTSVEEELTRGQWEIGAMGWNGSQAFTGTVFCAEQGPVEVSTGPVVFNLNLSNSTCFSSSLSTDSGVLETAPLKKFTPLQSVNFCHGDLSSLGSVDCQYNIIGTTNNKSMIGSYSFEVSGASRYQNQVTVHAGENLKSACFKPGEYTSIDSTLELNLLNLPSFVPGKGGTFRIVAHLGEDCSQTATSSIGQTSMFFSDTENFKSSITSGRRIFSKITHDQICFISNQRGNTNFFASGNGTINNPYLICNENQFYLLQRQYVNFRDKSFVLGADLDLLVGIKAGSVGVNPFSPCLEDGDTFIPIGYEISADCQSVTLPALGFSGHFDGSNKTIKNFRYKNSVSNVGLFSKVVDGKIANLRLEKVDIEAGDESGSLVGFVSGSTSMIKNIKVSGLNFRGKMQSGGVLGDAGSGLFQDIYVDKAILRAQGFSFGGIAGVFSGSLIENLSFNGVIEVEGPSIHSIGGIVGSAYSPLSKVVSSGAISGYFTKVGGIAGTSNSSISYARSDMFIYDRQIDNTTSDRHFGGIVGEPSGGVINRSVFTGKIQSECISSSCLIGNYAGVATHPVSYSVAQTASGLGAVSGTLANLDLVYNSSSLTSLCDSDGACPWSQLSGDIPRLDFESHPCKNITNNLPLDQQMSSPHLRGGLSNPVVICKASQFADLSSASISTHYIVSNHLNLSEAPSPFSFTGASLDGQGSILFSKNSAVFTEIAANRILKNFQIRGVKQHETCSSCNLGTLAETNYGFISNIEVGDSVLSASSGSPNIGGLVAINYRSILNSSVEHVILRAQGNMGGITYQNSGLIELSDSSASIQTLATSSGSDIGGVAGVLTQSGKLKRVEFNGEIRLNHSNENIGGIVGSASKGTPGAELTDVSVSSHAKLFLHTTAGSKISGVIGNIIGSSGNPVVLQRVVFNGLISTPSSNTMSTVRSIASSDISPSDISLSSTVVLKTPYKQSESLDYISNSGSFTNGICSLLFNYSSPTQIDFPGAYFTQSTSGKIVSGNFDSVGTQSVFTFNTKTKDSADCNSLATIGAASVYHQVSLPDSSPVYTGFDIVNGSDERLFGNYFAYLKGLTPPNPPVWEMDEEEGPRIFRFDK